MRSGSLTAFLDAADTERASRTRCTAIARRLQTPSAAAAASRGGRGGPRRTSGSVVRRSPGRRDTPAHGRAFLPVLADYQYNLVMPIHDFTGRQFGRLRVLRILPRRHAGTYWLCLCECGTEKAVKASHLVDGLILSCGCLKNELLSQRRLKHGMTETREYETWRGIKARCLNPNEPGYRYYGGRGITIHQSWKSSFEQFLADVGPRPSEKHTIERLDNNVGYEPGNVIWANRYVQGSNKRNNRRLEFRGQSRTIAEWGRIVGIDRRQIATRIDRLGWSVEKALSTPKRVVRSPRFAHMRPGPNVA